MKDKLIIIGDIVDGYPYTYQVVEELLKIKNLVFILGNHDKWFKEFISYGMSPNIWLHQGGANTLKSYHSQLDMTSLESGSIVDETKVDLLEVTIPVTHQEFFNTSKYYHKQDDMLFVHGGFDTTIEDMELQSKKDLVWDRSLIEYAKHNVIKGYKKVFIGHSTTELIDGSTEPVIRNNLYCLDCGAGHSGKLAIMDINTEEYWLSKKYER